MDERLFKLKTDFNNIIIVRNSIKNIFDTLQLRIDKLKAFYAEFIHTNPQSIFVFGLDSFRFQSKLIDIEYDDMRRLFLAMNNRMYCEYFKLYKIVVEYITQNVKDNKLIEMTKLSQFPIYKDLEPYREYPFEIIQEIHENILTLIGSLTTVLSNKEHELSVYKSKQNLGLNIDNFVTSYSFNVVIMREEISTFLTYIEFFHRLHTKYMKRFSNKIQLMYLHINSDIRFEDAIDMDNTPAKTQVLEMSKPILELDHDEELIDVKKNITPLKPEISRGSTLNSFGGASNDTKQSMYMIPTIDPKLTNDELRHIFSDINSSCDNIILNTPGHGSPKEDIGIEIEETTSVLSTECSTNHVLDKIREPHPIELIVHDLPVPFGKTAVPFGETIVLETAVPLGETVVLETAIPFGETALLETEVPPQEVEKPKGETIFQRIQRQKNTKK
jgi:hypothetical protein